MFDKEYINKLKDKYNYDDKTIKTLEEIIPKVLEYYGKENELAVLEALLNCIIVPCNSYQNISKVKQEKQQTKKIGMSPVGDIDLIRGEGVYYSSPKIIYNEPTNTFEIEKIERVIITPHQFNYDSPKGKEVLTYALCKLIKSYKDEYKIEENILTKRYGISEEVMQIIKNKDDIYLEITNEKGKALEEGFTIYDTEKIVSSVLKDEYQSYDYKSLFIIGYILKEKFNFKDEINNDEIEPNQEHFEKLMNKKDKELMDKCDKCFNLEQEMLISMSREEKDQIAKKLESLKENEIFSLLIEIYKTKKDHIKN